MGWEDREKRDRQREIGTETDRLSNTKTKIVQIEKRDRERLKE
jgi:hypothetical protein